MKYVPLFRPGAPLPSPRFRVLLSGERVDMWRMAGFRRLGEILDGKTSAGFDLSDWLAWNDRRRG